jgi:hypothetical protein
MSPTKSTPSSGPLRGGISTDEGQVGFIKQVTITNDDFEHGENLVQSVTFSQSGHPALEVFFEGSTLLELVI